jgi:hypothetical protein
MENQEVDQKVSVIDPTTLVLKKFFSDRLLFPFNFMHSSGNKSNRSILENAYNVSSDLGNIAKILATNGIDSVKSLYNRRIYIVIYHFIIVTSSAVVHCSSNLAVFSLLVGMAARVYMFGRVMKTRIDHLPVSLRIIGSNAV